MFYCGVLGAGLRIAAPFLLAASVVSLGRLPTARAALPALGLFTGPLGPALLALGAALSVVGIASQRRVRQPSEVVLFSLSFVLAAGLGLRHVARLGPTGDEIRYLIVAQSLWRDGDVDLRNNLERGDYREYVPDLRRGLGIRGHRGNPLVPLHRPGLPALVAPAYALAGRAGCVLLLAGLLSSLGLGVRRLARRATGDEHAALVAWAAATGPPALYFAAFLYPEVPAALAVTLVLAGANPRSRVAGAIGIALAASCLPWLHVRLIPGTAALGFVALLRLRGLARWAFVATAGGMAVAYLGYGKLVHGAWVPTRAYRGTLGNVPLEQALGGLLLDPSFGLLAYAPVFLLSLAAAPALLRRTDHWRLVLPVLVMALGIPVVTFGHWYGGFSPPARLLVSAVPVLALLVAMRVAEHGPSRRGLGRWATPLLLGGLGLAVFAFASPERKLHVQGRESVSRAWAALAGDVSVARYLPRLAKPADPAAVRPEAAPDERRVAIVWCLALGTLLALDRLAVRRDRVDRLFRSLALPLGLFLVLSLAVDHWARRNPAVPPILAPDAEEDEAAQAGG